MSPGPQLCLTPSREVLVCEKVLVPVGVVGEPGLPPANDLLPGIRWGSDGELPGVWPRGGVIVSLGLGPGALVSWGSVLVEAWSQGGVPEGLAAARALGPWRPGWWWGRPVECLTCVASFCLVSGVFRGPAEC